MVNAVGIGSGLDVTGIVDKIMQAERRPVMLLSSREQDYQAQLSAYGTIKSALADFENALSDLDSLDKFRQFNVQSTDEDALTATTDNQASSANHSVVINELATSHKLASTGFADGETSIGASGTMRITVNGNSFDIVVDPAKDALVDIRSSINNATDNVGVHAALLNIDDGASGTETRLVLTSDETGTANAISLIDVSGDVVTTLASTNMVSAKDAEFTLDGFDVTRSKNTVDDVLDGVTFNLKQADSSKTITLSVTRDSSAVKKNAQAFVDAYNKVITQVNMMHDDALEHDSSIYHIKTQLRDLFSQQATGVGSYEYLSDLGIGFTSTDGVADELLVLNATDFDEAMSAKFADVAKLFAQGTDSIIPKFKNVVDTMLDSDGLIETKTDSLDARIKNIQTKIDDRESQLARVEERYMRQFNELDLLISKLTTTNNYLNSQLENINSIKRK